MSTITDPVKMVMVPLLHFLKDHLDQSLAYAIHGELNRDGIKSNLVIVKSPRFNGNIMKLKLTFQNGFASCEIVDASGLSQIHPAA